MNERIESALQAATDDLNFASGDYGSTEDRARATRQALAELLTAVRLLAQEVKRQEPAAAPDYAEIAEAAAYDAAIATGMIPTARPEDPEHSGG